MKTFGLLALGGAMGLKFEDLSYNNLRDAFSKVRLSFYIQAELPVISKFSFLNEIHKNPMFTKPPPPD